MSPWYFLPSSWEYSFEPTCPAYFIIFFLLLLFFNISLFYFIDVHRVYWPYSSSFIPAFTLPSPTSTYPLPGPILYSCSSFLVPKSVFGEFSMDLSCECTILCSVQPSLWLSPSFSLLPLLFNSFQSVSLCHLPAQMQYILIFLISILFFFSSFPKFHKIVPLLQTCSLYKCAYDHVCFCVYIYLLDLSSTCERKHVSFVFLSLAYFN
jgi:hypothetical protein